MAILLQLLCLAVPVGLKKIVARLTKIGATVITMYVVRGPFLGESLRTFKNRSCSTPPSINASQDTILKESIKSQYEKVAERMDRAKNLLHS